MEPSRPADTHDPHHRPRRTARRRPAVVTAAVVLAGIAFPPAAAGARPAPRIDALRQRADQLGTRLEQLTEQFDGLRVRLQQAQRAAAVADATSAHATTTLRAVQRQVGRFAAQRYMNAADDDAPALLAAADPRTLLDRASTLHYFTQQDDAQVRQLTRAIQNARRAGQDARDRVAQENCLKAQLARQRAAIRRELDRVRRPLLKDAVDRADRGETIPPIPGGDTRALGAVRAALSQLGVPYVWGGAMPGRGFDCSGLTMWAYKQVGINLPHYGGDQWNAGVHVSRDQLEPGDLVFFYSDIHHMGMYIGDGKFVHAPHTGDRVRIADLSTRPFAGAVRVV